MVNSTKTISAIFISLMLTLGSLSAQVQPSLYQQMTQAFRQLDYGTAQKIGAQIVMDFRNYSPLELLEAHKILGVIAYLDGRLADANAQFEQALSIDRTTTLDSVYVSPKIIQFFEELKLHYNTSRPGDEPEKSIHFRYLIQPDPRPVAALRSMILPGWGQWYKKDKTKGYILIFAAATVAVTTTVFHFQQKDAHEAYLKASDPSTIEQKYDRYNLFFKLRNNAALVYGGIWLYSFFDALLATPKEQQLKVSVLLNEPPRICAQIFF